MSGCLILGDSAVQKLLIGLSKDDIVQVLDVLQDTLRQFSVGEERKFQPESSVINRPNGQKSLFRPFTSPSSVGTKIIVDPAPVRDESSQTEKKLPLHGILVVCDETGVPAGIINAEEITGFRTSASAIIGFTWRRCVDSIVVFGAGKQALWHIRLALALRGDEVKSITLINRSKPRAQELVDRVKEENASMWKSQAEFNIVESASSDYGSALKGLLAKADVIFCTVPSEKPLFTHGDLPAERRPYISAIGSWQPNMVEVDPKLVQRIAGDTAAYNPRHTGKGGILVVDDAEGAMKHAGEVVHSGLSKDQTIELGEILDMRTRSEESTQGLKAWLQDGLVVYKSIGVSLTDLAAGEAILKLAKQHGVGLQVSDL